MSLQGRMSLVAAVLCLLLSAADAGAATNMYLKLEGVAGASTERGHEGEIEVLSWSHGFVQPTSPTRSTAGSGTVEQATHQNLSITKYLDTASTAIMKLCWSGKQISKATLTCWRADGATGNKPVKYLEIAMTNVIISNFSVSGGPGDIPVENITLDYGSVQYTYMDQKHTDAGAVPPSLTAAAHPGGDAAPCTLRLPGDDDSLEVHSWNVAVGRNAQGALTFTTRSGEMVNMAVDAYRKAGKSGNVTLMCGTGKALTLTNVKVAHVASEPETGLTAVSLTYDAMQ